MMQKKRFLPLELKQLEALRKRIDPCHSQLGAITEEIEKVKGNYRRNVHIDNVLHLLNDEGLNLFHDLQLEDDWGVLSLNTLIVAKSFIAIVDVLQVEGEVTWKWNQFIAHRRSFPVRIPNPSSHVATLKIRLKRWLAQHSITAVPINAFVTYTEAETFLITDDSDVPVCDFDQLLAQLRDLHYFSPPTLPEASLISLCDLFKNSHVSSKLNVLEVFNISESEVLKGVHCPDCRALPMKRYPQIWQCPWCLFRSNNAHQTALYEYQLLYKDTISNKECQEFLMIDSPRNSYNLLTSVEVKSRREHKGREYYLSPIL